MHCKHCSMYMIGACCILVLNACSLRTLSIYLFINTFFFPFTFSCKWIWYLFEMQHRVSAVTLNQTMPRISEDDLQACRHRISVFLAAHTAYELLPESGKVWMHSYQPSFMIYALIYACYFPC